MDKQKRKKLYRDRDLVERHLLDSGIDLQDERTWNRLSRSQKDEIGLQLALKGGLADSDAGYCSWVIANYFGQKRGLERGLEGLNALAKARIEELSTQKGRSA